MKTHIVDLIVSSISENSSNFKNYINEVKESYEKHFWTCEFSEDFINSNEFKEKLETYNWKILAKFLFAFQEDETKISFNESIKEFNYKILNFSDKSLESTLLFETYNDAKNFLNHYLEDETKRNDSNNFILFVEGDNVFNYYK